MLYITLLISAVIFLILLYQLKKMIHKNTVIKDQLTSAEVELLNEQRKVQQQAQELKDLQQQLEITASKDTLTGLINRHIFEDRLIQIVNQSQRYQFIFAVVFLNLDSFKVINDVLGLQAGDQLLKEVANRLQASVRKIDTVSHFSGDEFIVLLPQLSKSEMAGYVVQRLLNAIAEPFYINQQEIFITATAGIALFPHDGSDASMLLKNAENALHQAKANRPNHFCFYQTEMNKVGQRLLTLNASLHNHSLYQYLQIYYQPRIQLSTKKILCMEAIVQWRHPELGLVDFKDCVKLIEDHASILKISEWLIKNICTQYQTWQSQDVHIQAISMNVALKQLENPHFIYQISQALKEYGIHPAHFMIEIMELSKTGMGEKSLLMLKDMGIHIGVENVGIGNIALQELLHFPIQSIKIGKEFIQEITFNTKMVSLVKMIISLANSLNQQVIAAGVETQEQMQLLKSLGCDIMQGNLFSPPILPREFTMLIEQSILEGV